MEERDGQSSSIKGWERCNLLNETNIGTVLRTTTDSFFGGNEVAFVWTFLNGSIHGVLLYCHVAVFEWN